MLVRNIMKVEVYLFMLKITDSDIFKLQDSAGVLTNKISAVLKKGMSGFTGNDIIILNNLMADSLQNMKRMYNDPIVLNILNAINDGTMVLVKLSIEYNIPKCMPFVRYIGQDKKEKVLVNLSHFVEVKKNSLGDDMYFMSAQRLYPILVSAYLALKTFTNTYILPAKALGPSAYIWAAMFNKVLCRSIALGTNKDRYDAFMYFAMKFFCLNIAEVPEVVAEDVAKGYLLKKGRKDFPMLEEILIKIHERGLNPYRSFQEFCRVLFNNEITNLRVNAQRAVNEINTTFFLNRFVDQFKYESLFALGAYPYFLYTVMNAAFKTRVVNDQAFQDILGDKDYSAFQMINALL